MMKYERLTERAENGKPYFNGCLTCELESDCGSCPDWVETLDRLAELEDKIEQGLMIELPCKVGDTVYVVFKRRWKVGTKVEYWNIQKSKLTYINMERVIKEYGEFVFLTREEAEAKLKELQNG